MVIGARLWNPRPLLLMKYAVALALACCSVPWMVAAVPPPAKKSVAQSKAMASKKAAPVIAKKGAVGTAVPVRNRFFRTVRRPARTYVPQQPTSDRYREIQDALAAKGYLQSPSSGVWDQQSMDAMRRFQEDQKLDPTGKLTARSLSALGLGSKTSESSAMVPNAPSGVSAKPEGEGSALR